VFETVHPRSTVEFNANQSSGNAVCDFAVTYADGRKAVLDANIADS